MLHTFLTLSSLHVSSRVSNNESFICLSRWMNIFYLASLNAMKSCFKTKMAEIQTHFHKAKSLHHLEPKLTGLFAKSLTSRKYGAFGTSFDVNLITTFLANTPTSNSNVFSVIPYDNHKLYNNIFILIDLLFYRYCFRNCARNLISNLKNI
jgi:hypothetical protein